MAQKKLNCFYAVGRRKTATARARVYPGNGEVMVGDKKLTKGETYVNNMPIEKYFPAAAQKAVYSEVFHCTNSANRFIVTLKVVGSGKSGQLGAVSLAIARGLSLADPKFKEILASKGFLTRDPRSREREKPGLMGARKQKSSPKR